MLKVLKTGNPESMKQPLKLLAKGAAVIGISLSMGASAADWSDTSLTWHYGTQFAEPFEGNNITKNIASLTHASGYKYGSNFFNVDMLYSDTKDPAAINSTNGAQEIYIVYRNTVDLGKVTESDFKFGPVKGLGITFGFDTNTKTDTGYNSKKQMLVAGATFMMDVPGFMNISVLEAWESNAPSGWDFNAGKTYSVGRYSYAPHPIVSLAWGIPIGTSAFSFDGFLNYNFAKGKDEFGNDTKDETFFDGQIMADIGQLIGGAKNTFKLGVEYQYWMNKFGTDASGPAGSGAFAKTPLVRAEYHF